MVRPKKHLGQHFLTDRSIAGRIVASLELTPGDTVIEVGPGKGILTGPLLEKDIRLIAIEIDPESVTHLRKEWPSLASNLVEQDILKADLNALSGGPFHLIGNFPYNISSQIFFRILAFRQSVQSVVCMVQKEVAERIASPPGSRDYGILSVLLGAFFEIEMLFTVKPGSFFPPPKVTSGVIRMNRNRVRQLPCNEALFFRIVKSTFNQRRKMIRNSIKSILLHLDSDFDLLRNRPEELGVPEFIELTRWVESQQSVTP
ncbi:MAG: 16S rRNA (adenine(1518)-N(6)/adenine(1519)-N(6))-dimethyltransferase RsmA [Bacteroidales bacterium]